MSKFKGLLFRWYPVVIAFLLGGVVGGIAVEQFSGDCIEKGGKSAKGYEIRQSGRYTNPLLECECEMSSDAVGNKELKPFKHKVQDFVDERINSMRASHISIYFRDLNNGPWFGINEHEEFSPASLLKVPILISYLKLAESDPKLLVKKFKYKGGYDYNSIENIKATKTLEKGKTYTAEDLLYMMIVYSDNNARDILLQNMDAEAFAQPFVDLGLEVPGVRKFEDFMSVAAYASFFRILFNASYLSRGMSEKALGYLAKVEFRYGLVAGVPNGIEVAHKFGERRILDVEGDHVQGEIKQVHDCGIIYYQNNPYLLCVMTRGNNFENLFDTIKGVSYLVFKEIDEQHRTK